MPYGKLIRKRKYGGDGGGSMCVKYRVKGDGGEKDKCMLRLNDPI